LGMGMGMRVRVMVAVTLQGRNWEIITIIAAPNRCFAFPNTLISLTFSMTRVDCFLYNVRVQVFLLVLFLFLFYYLLTLQYQNEQVQSDSCYNMRFKNDIQGERPVALGVYSELDCNEKTKGNIRTNGETDRQTWEVHDLLKKGYHRRGSRGRGRDERDYHRSSISNSPSSSPKSKVHSSSSSPNVSVSLILAFSGNSP